MHREVRARHTRGKQFRQTATVNDVLPPPIARVMVVGKPECHLCEDAVAVVAEVCGRTGDSWAVVSTYDYPELADAYAYDIPVIFVDQRRHDYHRVDPTRLERALANG